ncbi:hypothetical protein JHK85_007620 [Glycine max]|uniref:Aconitase/3-isopropylmalate dehydratase large subunit alpha/beta/alpha domain-containing protein n=1 Tax=Glycine max TaxID=3847 RepID=K7KEU6_SOYBN|nr:hypothetical protein JHK85_007620 [Glycine max]KAG5072189.1 hypothetical protein JHK86_007400 [Glycine max]
MAEEFVKGSVHQNGVANTLVELCSTQMAGTDSHTTMIDGLGVARWGVGGIKAEAAMLGQVKLTCYVWCECHFHAKKFVRVFIFSGIGIEVLLFVLFLKCMKSICFYVIVSKSLPLPFT